MSIDRDEIRRHISAGTCPWCDKGPFKMLPVHTNKAHGIDKWQLRDLAGLTTTQPLCDPEALAKMSSAQTANPHVEAATVASRARRSPQRWTAAGRAKQSQNLAEHQSRLTPSERQEAARFAASHVTPEGREKVRAANRRRMADPKERERLSQSIKDPQHWAKMQRGLADYQARRALQPCGTRAAYRRGCRCASCVEAFRASKRKQQR